MKKTEMNTKDKWITKAAVIALLAGMVVAFLQGFNVYAAAEMKEANQKVEQSAALTAENGAQQTTVIADEAVPAAQLPTGSFPWWCYLVAVGSIAAGCAVYVYIQRAERKSAVKVS